MLDKKKKKKNDRQTQLKMTHNALSKFFLLLDMALESIM